MKNIIFSTHQYYKFLQPIETDRDCAVPTRILRTGLTRSRNVEPSIRNIKEKIDLNYNRPWTTVAACSYAAVISRGYAIAMGLINDPETLQVLQNA